MVKIKWIGLALIFVCFIACSKKEAPEKDKREDEEIPLSPQDPVQPGSVRCLVYNIRHGAGMDNIVDMSRILKVIKESGATIVALNEVDRHYSSRSNYEDQVAYLAKELGMNYLYQATTNNEPNAASGNKPREHGHALMSKYPVLDSEPRFFSVGDDYGRGILRAKLNVDGQVLQVYVTHWGLNETVRFNHIKETVMFMNEFPGKSMLMGDLNAMPNEHNIIALKSRLNDATADNLYTFPADNPVRKIDYILVSRSMEAAKAKVIDTKASDHRPVVADIKMDKVIDNSLLYPKFPESFEINDGNFINYEGGDRERTFPTGVWNLTRAGIVPARLVYDDRPTTGMDAIRMQHNISASAYVEMKFDVPDGASKVTLWYGSYYKDVSCTWRLEQSVDGGNTWNQVGPDIKDAEAVKKQAIFNVNISGPVRFRVHKLGLGTTNISEGILNGRLCIDDFAIYKNKIKL